MLSRPCPSIVDSTREERLAYVQERYTCISDCDLCGICASFGWQNPEDVLADYIDGKDEMRAVLVRFRQRRGSR